MGYTRTTHREFHHLLYSQLKHSASPCNEQETIPYMTAHQLLFSLSYQAPAIVMGLLVAALIPYPPLRAIFVLPGTFVHELLHFIVGQLLNAKPVSFSVWPKRVGPSTWAMGSVVFANVRWYNGAAIGLAPLFAPAAAIWLAPDASTWKVSVADLKYWALAAPVFAMCLPSWADIRICFASIMPIAAIVALLWWLRH
jgi:hypothetical protein